MQHEIHIPGPLLDKSGSLNEAGFARKMHLEYDRKAIKAHGMRIKEWDYYLIYDDEVAVALTVADNSYMSLMSASYIDFSTPFEKTVSSIRPLTFGRTKMPSSSAEGSIKYRDSRCNIFFQVGEHSRNLSFWMDNFADKKPFDAKFALFDEPAESMVIATPFHNDKKAFYYNQKIIAMRAQGRVICPSGSHDFDPQKSFALLDWGRGVWTYDNTWYWGAAHGLADGKIIGFNIGYGFGDTTAASENIAFIDGKVHKLDQVSFNIPQKEDGTCDYLKPWTFSSNDGRFEMDFIPIIDRAARTSFAIILSDQHQVFGRFSGKMVLDDGTTIQVKDLIGFAEKVRNKW